MKLQVLRHYYTSSCKFENMQQKSLAFNAFFNIIYKSLNLVFPLITMMYVSRVLLPEGVGKVASAQNIATYFVVLASLGLPIYGIKKIAECNDDKIQCSKIFSELFTINAISSIVCSTIYIIMTFSVGYFQSKLLISLVVGIQLFANIFNIDWFYQGIEEYKYIMQRSLVIKIFSLGCVFIFIHDSSDYITYAFITALSLVANFVFNIVHVKHFVKLQLINLELKRHLRPIFTLLAASVAIEIYTLTDITMLNFMKGDEIVGYYTNATKSVAITRSLIAAVCAVFLPRLNHYLSHGQTTEFNSLAAKGVNILCTISIPIAVCLTVYSSNLITILFGLNYLPSTLAMQILSISVITVALSNFIGYQILVSIGKEKKVLYSTIYGALINLILNCLLIPRFDHFGAALASVASEGFITVYQYWYAKKYSSIKITNKQLLSIIIPTIGVFAVTIISKVIFENIFVELFVGGVMAMILYVYGLYFFKNDFAIILANKLKIKI